jgi:hypothetical protein
VANREEVVLSAGFDGAKLEQGAKKAFGTVDREAQKAGAALGKFGLSGEGVLTKLARTLSLTDIAAGAVFATIAKGQAVVRDSLKAFEDYQRSISAVGDGITTYSERMDELNRTINENNVAIGSALSPFAQFGKVLEEAASTGLVRFLEKAQELGREYEKNPFLRAAILGLPGVGLLAGQVAGTLGRGANVGSGSAGYQRFGPDVPQDFYLSQVREQEAATKKATEDAMRAAERLFDNLVRGTRPNVGAIGGGAAGFDISGPFGIGGPVSVPQPVQRTGPEFNEEALKAYEEAQRRSQEFREQFAANIGSGLSSAILESQNFAQAIGNIFKQTFAKILSDAGGSLFSSLLGGGPIGIFASLSTGRAAPGVTPATQSMARTLAPAMRREASVGRGF